VNGTSAATTHVLFRSVRYPLDICYATMRDCSLQRLQSIVYIIMIMERPLYIFAYICYPGCQRVFMTNMTQQVVDYSRIFHRTLCPRVFRNYSRVDSDVTVIDVIQAARIENSLAHRRKTFVRWVNNVKMRFMKINFKTLNKNVFQNYFGPLAKLLLKQYRAWQCGERSTETFKL